MTFASPSKIYVEAGQTSLLDIPSESSLEMNPKKILEIETAGKGQVRLLALRSGIALLKASSPSGEKTWIIEVLGRDQQNDWLLRKEWQSYFCEKPGVKCDGENTVLSGEVDDLAWYYEARQICKKKMPCSWRIGLSLLAREKARRDLTPQHESFHLDVDEEGAITLRYACEESNKKALDQIRRNLEERFHVSPQILCLARSPDLWRLDVLVIADRESAGEISNPLQWERIEIPSRQPLHAFIAELSQKNHMHIVAEPELSLSLGATAYVRDGQEIQTHAIQKDTEEILWKTSGFRLEIKLLEIREGLARIQVKMNLSQPQAGLRTIDASEFASEVWVPQQSLHRIGRMRATLKGEDDNRIPWLSAIPDRKSVV